MRKQYFLLASASLACVAFSVQAQVTYPSANTLPNWQAAHNFTNNGTSVMKIRQDGRVGIRVGSYPDWEAKSFFNVGFRMGSFTADNMVPYTSGEAATCIGFNAALQDDGHFFVGSTGGAAPRNGGSVAWGGSDGSLHFSTVPSTNSTADQYPPAISLTSTYRRLSIEPGGQVHIGRGPTPASPHFSNYKLAVDGKLVAQSIHVVGSVDWADFVFAPTYRLMPLPELERYLQQHRHLPAIPSAQEVQAQGVDLAAMQSKLLQQLEELTLRVIELDKQNRLLQGQVQVLANSSALNARLKPRPLFHR